MVGVGQGGVVVARASKRGAGVPMTPIVGMQVEHGPQGAGAWVMTLTVHPDVNVSTAGGGVGSCPGEQVVAPSKMHMTSHMTCPIRLVETVVVDVQEVVPRTLRNSQRLLIYQSCCTVKKMNGC